MAVSPYPWHASLSTVCQHYLSNTNKEAMASSLLVIAALVLCTVLAPRSTGQQEDPRTRLQKRCDDLCIRASFRCGPWKACHELRKTCTATCNACVAACDAPSFVCTMATCDALLAAQTATCLAKEKSCWETNQHFYLLFLCSHE